MRRILVPFVCFVCTLAGLASPAAVPGFATTVPSDGAEVSLMTDSQKEFVLMPMAVRRERFADAEYRRRLAEGKWFQRPVRLVWTWNGPESEGGPLFSVEVTRAKDGLPVALLSAATTNAVVDNLEIATEYTWRVTPVLMGRKLDVQALGRFKTAGYAPRTLRIDGVANSRDLGGRVGLGGRRVRQGLVFRTAGLNANATPVNPAGKKKTADGKDVVSKERKKGKVLITETGKRYMLDVLGIRTDIDLRSSGETFGMTGSPLGDGCRWVRHSSCCYGNMDSEKGRKAFAAVFRLFLDRRNYPILFHCIGGKDRTGSLAFILNGLLGVSENELYLDWEATGFWNRRTDFVHKGLLDNLVKCFDKYEGGTINDRICAYVKSTGFTDADIEVFRVIMLESEGY